MVCPISRQLACVAVLLAATLLDLAADAGASGAPSWVLLVAPVLPLVGVAASWSRVFDPAYDLVAATPAAGLPLLLWRTTVVLAVMVPAALIAGVVADTGGVATWLLPCLALTAASLALGSVTGMVRATGVAAGAWAAGVVAPALAIQQTPAALEPAWLPVWGALTILAAGAIALRRKAYRRLGRMTCRPRPPHTIRWRRRARTRSRRRLSPCARAAISRWNGST